MGEAKRRKKLDPNYGKKRQFTRSQLERKKHECLKNGDWHGAASIMYDMGDRMVDEKYQTIECSKDEFIEDFVNQASISAKANRKFSNRIRKF